MCDQCGHPIDDHGSDAYCMACERSEKGPCRRREVEARNLIALMREVGAEQKALSAWVRNSDA